MGSFILSDTFATTNELRKRIIKLEKVNENIIDQEKDSTKHSEAFRKLMARLLISLLMLKANFSVPNNRNVQWKSSKERNLIYACH